MFIIVYNVIFYYKLKLSINVYNTCYISDITEEIIDKNAFQHMKQFQSITEFPETSP